MYPISSKNFLYSEWSCSEPFLSRCHWSILDWISSLFASNSLFLGENSLTISSNEDQKFSGVIFSPSRTSFSKKPFNSFETFKEAFVLSFSSEFSWGELKRDNNFVNMFVSKL